MQLLLDLFQQAVHVILHLDLYVTNWITGLGPGIYILLFMVIFAETGLVVAPFLPGDSFLFALGALTAVTNAYLDLPILLVSLTVAAILGDSVNYTIGKFIGPKVFKKDTGIFLNKKHLVRAQKFYDKHGGKTIIIARFAPIIRTFAPFVAGIGHMNYGRFSAYNVIGGIAWVWSFLLAGHFFGNLPQVKTNFHTLIFAIIIISVLPVFFEAWRSYREEKAAKA